MSARLVKLPILWVLATMHSLLKQVLFSVLLFFHQGQTNSIKLGYSSTVIFLPHFGIPSLTLKPLKLVASQNNITHLKINREVAVKCE